MIWVKEVPGNPPNRCKTVVPKMSADDRDQPRRQHPLHFGQHPQTRYAIWRLYVMRRSMVQELLRRFPVCG